VAGGDRSVGAFGLLYCLLRAQLDDRVDRGVDCIDPAQQDLDQLA
jgi:hypothetical protein